MEWDELHHHKQQNKAPTYQYLDASGGWWKTDARRFLNPTASETLCRVLLLSGSRSKSSSREGTEGPPAGSSLCQATTGSLRLTSCTNGLAQV